MFKDVIHVLFFHNIFLETLVVIDYKF